VDVCGIEFTVRWGAAYQAAGAFVNEKRTRGVNFFALLRSTRRNRKESASVNVQVCKTDPGMGCLRERAPGGAGHAWKLIVDDGSREPS
jgi:hypothetical protein